MDRLTNVLAALNAGKLPSQDQLNAFNDWIKVNALAQMEPGHLSPQGRVMVRHIGTILDAYRTLGSNKNSDDLLQEAIWHLSEGDISVPAPSDVVDTDEAAQDVEKIRKALRKLLQIAWSSISSEDSFVFRDFASFARSSLADAAEMVEDQAARAKDSLREVEQEVQEGKRDTLGRDKERMEEEEKDVKVQFEHTMDSLKDTGATVIGAGQDAKAKAEELADRTGDRLKNAFQRACEQAQKDEEYRSAVNTLLDTKHVSKALKELKTLVERFANNRSLNDLFAKAKQCAIDVREDKDLQKWFQELLQVIRKTINDVGYMQSEELKQTKKDLRTRWKKFFVEDSKWKTHYGALRNELNAFEAALSQDKDTKRLRDAHVQLGKAIEHGLVEAGAQAKSGLHAAMEQASWFWRDIFQVYIPRALTFMKGFPIPRTEYIDKDSELVLENLDISSFNIQPSHIYIRNITDIDINTVSANAPTRTAIGTLTHIRAQAIQLALDKVSFFYRDKRASVVPSDYSGLVSFTLPPKGVDIDLKLRLIPATEEREVKRGTRIRERELHQAFHVIEHVRVDITSDVGLTIAQSNHPMLLSVFKPLVTLRFREAVERALTEQIRGAIEWADGIAWDVSKRAEVFTDGGMGIGSALSAAMWSELGRLRKMSGWQAIGTGTGVVVEGGKDTALAMGAEPQILSGEKKGPLDQLAGEVGAEDAQAVREVGREEVTGLKRGVEAMATEGKRQFQSFMQRVEEKTAQEKKTKGWRSAAFNIKA
ncbi:uncharacterized protein EV420DRAFT_1502084 [Desarmillaria tabescens]|uniref:Uncharacterized protein n=1 Tax=Armillaria tabescens TaxID=1929756 RepID=A0AA39U098_ARMTA|nr:uncharacterized protein EV420DRAFT_1502084 [Desarmillaria tabescens]KAK0467954.1 hypothetical protein EV420DRAFT_1502084 [Desarmillaria tabescens]